ncbi:MAG: 2-phospho-L-lactate guanylyltransferase [Acidimicrobiales bacterium]
MVFGGLGGSDGKRRAVTAVVIPIKAFDTAKGRLAGRLDPPARAALARSMAETVVKAAHPLRVWIVCDNDGVATWAREQRADVVWPTEPGLDAAVTAGVEAAVGAGAERVIVAHADLPRATTLAWVADFDGVTIVPDRRGDGTNVMALPAGSTFRFAYGPGSARRHHQRALDAGLAVRVAPDADLGWDVDTPADLPGVDSHAGGPTPIDPITDPARDRSPS